MSQQRIREANQPHLTSEQMARDLGYTARYVRKVRKRLGLPRPAQGAQRGQRNHGWREGRHVDLDGYVLVQAPEGYQGQTRKSGQVYEHRLVLEQSLGRTLAPGEVADHIDGLTLHNAPSNLRVFATNADHLRETLAGRPKRISHSGRLNIAAALQPGARTPVDTYRLRRESGDVRLRQMLLAALSLGTDSPHLSGTLDHFERAGIDWRSRPTLERALADLEKRWAAVLAQ